MDNQLILKEAEAQLSEDWLSNLMDMQLTRNYINSLHHPEQWALSVDGLHDPFDWLQIDRLPLDQADGQQLMLSWQNILSACHTLNMKIAFVLRRVMGRTRIYVGGIPSGGSGSAANVLRQCMSVHLPGSVLQNQDSGFSMAEELEDVGVCSGVITGIPSLQVKDDKPWRQTLDKLARGITSGGSQKNYALVVIADPAQDEEISQLQQRLLRIKSEIHSLASCNESQSKQEGSSSSKGTSHHSGFGMMLGLMKSASYLCMLADPLLGTLGALGTTTLAPIMESLVGNKNDNQGKSQSLSQSLSREHRDFIVSYCEKLLDKHITRMEGGRSTGFWQVGAYVLGEERETVDSVLALLRSIYSGSESYVEPVRVMNTTGSEAIRQMIVNMRFVPLPIPAAEGQKHWHVLGRMYESLTTPLTTPELSITTGLPQNDVSGLRFVRNAVHFAVTPAPVPRKDAITLGKVMDYGVQQTTAYSMDVNALVRHTLVAGSTGSGKSTTCKRILQEVLNKDIPVLIIEPAKDDYVQWAMKMNQTLPEDRQFTIYMPGADEFNGIELPKFHLNPFQPAAYADSPVRLQQHSEHFSTLLNACLPSEDVIPILIDEAVQFCLRVKAGNAGIDLEKSLNPQMEKYPTMVSLSCAGNTIIKHKTYAPQTKDSFEEILRTRFQYLQRGTRGSILNTDRSVDFDRLFSRPAVINLSCLAGQKDKALVMSLLLLALYEYRQSRYAYDPAYRDAARQNRLMHLMLVEEAHNVLTKPDGNVSSGSPERAAADLFTSILSEIRSYGQGLMIVDQVPTRLIEDALKNTNYKIIHRLTAPDDIEAMARSISLNREQTDMISSLEIGHAIVCGDQDDGAAWVRMERA